MSTNDHEFGVPSICVVAPGDESSFTGSNATQLHSTGNDYSGAQSYIENIGFQKEGPSGSLFQNDNATQSDHQASDLDNLDLFDSDGIFAEAYAMPNADLYSLPHSPFPYSPASLYNGNLDDSPYSHTSDVSFNDGRVSPVPPSPSNVSASPLVGLMYNFEIRDQDQESSQIHRRYSDSGPASGLSPMLCNPSYTSLDMEHMHSEQPSTINPSDLDQGHGINISYTPSSSSPSLPIVNYDNMSGYSADSSYPSSPAPVFIDDSDCQSGFSFDKEQQAHITSPTRPPIRGLSIKTELTQSMIGHRSTMSDSSFLSPHSPMSTRHNRSMSASTPSSRRQTPYPSPHAASIPLPHSPIDSPHELTPSVSRTRSLHVNFGRNRSHSTGGGGLHRNRTVPNPFPGSRNFSEASGAFSAAIYPQTSPAYHPYNEVYNEVKPLPPTPTDSEGQDESSGLGRSSSGSSAYKKKVATEKMIGASKLRRKNPRQTGTFICDECGQDFTAKHNLKNHQNSHNGIKPFSCEACFETFTTQAVSKRHTKTCPLIKRH